MKRTNSLTRILCLALILVLTAAMALGMTACTKNSPDDVSSVATATQMEFTFKVVDGEGNEETFNIKTDKTTVGDALLEEGLISGEQGDYGLYVKTVNNITADFNVDGTYWAFYIGDEYAMTGVDATEIENGATYTFKIEK